ncbi:MAG TPA: DUF3891 family protein [Miltoncostaeaceae bacterium]|nr:DUF3891 family protein [Miltoncostaeaceae bacterium]
MIVLRADGRLRLVRQVDHQGQCGLMARAWGNGEFARPEPYAPLITAADLHDEGWRDWEERPRVGADGAPVDFPDLPRTVHVDLYERGIAHVEALEPRAGLVVCLHGRGLYEKRLGLDGEPPPREGRPPHEREFIARQEARERRLRDGLGGGAAVEEWAWAGFRLLQAWDVLSLYLTWHGLARGGAWTLPAVPRGVGDPGATLRVAAGGPETCTVDPWPFAADEVALPVTARTIPDRAYADDGDLWRALDAAPEETVTFRARRA